jgi:hypothetical protein
MKTVTLALLLVLFSAVFGFANVCQVGTYDTYLGSGFSCGIGSNDFFNFSYSTAGTDHMPASSITVNPISTPGNPGFLFNAPWGVTSGSTQDSLIGFTIMSSNAPITDLTLQMFGAQVQGTGLVTVGEDYCLGDTFSNGCAKGIEGNLSTFLSSGGGKLSDSVNFSGVNEIDVKDSIELLGGSNGFAVLSGVQNTFSQGTGTVPEPGSMVLFGSGALCLAGVLRRRLNL